MSPLQGFSMRYFNMKGRVDISKENFQEEGVYFIRDLSEISVVVWMIGLLQSDIV